MPPEDVITPKDSLRLVSLINAINKNDTQTLSGIIQQIIKDDPSRNKLIKIITYFSGDLDGCNLLMLAALKRKIESIDLLLDIVQGFPRQYKYKVIGQRNKEGKNVLRIAVENQCALLVVERLKSIYKESVENAFSAFIKHHPVGKDCIGSQIRFHFKHTN